MAATVTKAKCNCPPIDIEELADAAFVLALTEVPQFWARNVRNPCLVCRARP